MTDFALIVELLGLTAISAVALYFLVWREPAARSSRQKASPGARPSARERHKH